MLRNITLSIVLLSSTVAYGADATLPSAASAAASADSAKHAEVIRIERTLSNTLCCARFNNRADKISANNAAIIDRDSRKVFEFGPDHKRTQLGVAIETAYTEAMEGLTSENKKDRFLKLAQFTVDHFIKMVREHYRRNETEEANFIFEYDRVTLSMVRDLAETEGGLVTPNIDLVDAYFVLSNSEHAGLLFVVKKALDLGMGVSDVLTQIIPAVETHALYKEKPEEMRESLVQFLTAISR